MARRAFVDVTGRLISHGYIDKGPAGTSAIDVPDEFPFFPPDGWKWNGDDPATFTPFPFPPPTDSALKTALKDLLADDTAKGKLDKKLVAVLIELEKVTR